jgi:hypothetical protein
VKLENEPDKKIHTLRLKLDFVVYEDGTFVSSVKDGAEAVLRHDLRGFVTERFEEFLSFRESRKNRRFFGDPYAIRSGKHD